MSDEKRPTRLLAFRLRRDGAARSRGAGYNPDARDDAARGVEFSEDAELSALLRAWDAPAPTPHSRERLLAEFRSTARRVPLWRRALSAELRVPLPVAACAALCVLASLFVLASRAQTTARTAAATQTAHAEVRAAEGAPALKIVEVPVERERVVTRYVYVERNARAADAQQFAATQEATSTQRSTATRAAVAQSNSGREDTRGVRTTVDASAQSSGEPTSYFTRVDMADFQPAEKMELRIVKRGKTDEK